MKKLKIAILFGGKSVEHEVSIHSAKNVFLALDKKKYLPILIYLDKNNRWFLADSKALIDFSYHSKFKGAKDEIVLIPGGHGKIVNLAKPKQNLQVDVVFPVLHGTFGEDGTIQGLLKLAGVPFVGAGVLGSAVGMDKEIAKNLLKNAGLPIGNFLTFRNNERINLKEIIKKLGWPLFVKPAALGSSVGISKVKNEKELSAAIKKAFQYDHKILVEEFVAGREIECAVLGNENPKATLPGEIIPTHEFYSYAAKYLDDHGARLVIPAKLPPVIVKKIKILAVNAFRILACEGMARVDFFLKKNGEMVISEINTIPGFTQISMYPKLWQLTGLSYSGLIDELIKLAVARFKKEKN
jgi:D-alanine-D-alanine ligase